jgi:hypothetical protein
MSKALMLIGTAGDLPIHLIYGAEVGDPRPFILLTVTPEYVAHKTSKPLPIDRGEFAHFVHNNAEDLMKLAISCRDRGKISAVLTATPAKEPHKSTTFVVGRRYRKLLQSWQATEASKAKA